MAAVGTLLLISLAWQVCVLAVNGSHYTNTWSVEFHPDLSEEEVRVIAYSHGFNSRGKIFPNSVYYELHHPEVPSHSHIHSPEPTRLLSTHKHVKSVEQQKARKRVKRSETNIELADPLWHQTWYLNRAVDQPSKVDMNVIAAWQRGYTGKGSVVTIVDDGIERTHPDLQQNYAASASTDINGQDSDPTPRYDPTNENRHGTRCAGEVAASANNTFCSVGVAYNAGIGGIRMLDGAVTDIVEARALSFNLDVIDIYSSSWGPDDDGATVEGPGMHAQDALKGGVTKGRNGKGNIFVWASGNGGIYSDSCACDGYTNSIYTLSVSSVSEGGNSPFYLEQCASTLASTYSSGSGTERKVVTTDLNGRCTTTHSGTSASAPLAAGLLAVTLEANPSLTWRDVQYITLASANPQPMISSGEFKTNGAGRKYSHKYGYGLMDCGKMVEMAESWQTVPEQLLSQLPVVFPQHQLTNKYVKEIVISNCSANDTCCIRYLEHVQVTLSLTSEKRGQLTVKLISPHGTESTLLPTRSQDTTSTGFSNWSLMSVHFWSENPSGTWKLEISNGNRSGKVESFQLSFYGVAINPFDRNMAPPSSSYQQPCTWPTQDITSLSHLVSIPSLSLIWLSLFTAWLAG
ncbi:proprotein convertase subtilisin/kexin type 6-like [Watersipora subatra]|uniref:proprotein convertase subtilisin/kexin type 6-like n=1 Tax=Watersipora subatra TaxID=2589382 RepID=UPI00355B1EF5